MAGGEIIRLRIDKQHKCPPAATVAASEPRANYAVMIALLLWTSQATVQVMSLNLPHPQQDLHSSFFPHLRTPVISPSHRQLPSKIWQQKCSIIQPLQNKSPCFSRGCYSHQYQLVHSKRKVSSEQEKGKGIFFFFDEKDPQISKKNNNNDENWAFQNKSPWPSFLQM